MAWTRLLLPPLLVILAALLGSCSRDELPDNEPRELSMAFDLWPGYYPAIIAHEQGWFAREGVSVRLQVPTETNHLVAAFAAREFDLAGLTLGDALRTTRANRDVQVIAMVDDSRGADVILASGQSLNRLQGQRIGVSLGGFGELLVKKFLESRGLSRTDVSLVHASASQVPHLLQSGEIDYGHTWEPYASQARNQGAREVFSSAQTPGFIPDVLIVQGKIARKHPEELRRFLRAWFKAQQWWLEHPREGNQLIARFLKQKPEEISLEGIAPTSLESNRSMLDLQNRAGLTALTSIYQEYFIRRNLVTHGITPEEFINRSFLP